jgi:hypothetical protein
VTGYTSALAYVVGPIVIDMMVMAELLHCIFVILKSKPLVMRVVSSDLATVGMPSCPLTYKYVRDASLRSLEPLSEAPIGL